MIHLKKLILTSAFLAPLAQGAVTSTYIQITMQCELAGEDYDLLAYSKVNVKQSSPGQRVSDIVNISLMSRTSHVKIPFATYKSDKVFNYNQLYEQPRLALLFLSSEVYKANNIATIMDINGLSKGFGQIQTAEENNPYNGDDGVCFALNTKPIAESLYNLVLLAQRNQK